MGKLRHLSSGLVRCLAPEAELGRGRTFPLDRVDISRLHCRVRWVDSEWVVQDHGSVNGTFVDGVLVPRGTAWPLVKGASIGLGRFEADFLFIDASPPRAFASHSVTGEEQEEDALGTIRVEGTVLCALEDGTWGTMQEGVFAPLDPHRLIPWVLHVPELAPATLQRAAHLDDCTFRFHVSTDLSTIRLVVVTPNREIDFGASEVFFPLLLLARERKASDGWIPAPRLCRLAGMNKEYLDVALGRSRRLLLLAGVIGADKVYDAPRGRRRIAVDPTRIIEVVEA